jgi:hypothetical protein
LLIEPKPSAQIAQLVEQRIENPRVAGSIPALGTIFSLMILDSYDEIAVSRDTLIFALGVGCAW